MSHPRDVLLGARPLAVLPVCDHYSGVESRMVKSLALQLEMTQEFGACVFDVSLDCEDGAPVGGEKDHAQMVVAMVNEHHHRAKVRGEMVRLRTAVRVHPVDHPAFRDDLSIILGGVADHLCHVMVPKVESVEDVKRVVEVMDTCRPRAMQAIDGDQLPIHVLIESPGAVRNAFEIAAHPRVQSLSFGLMDFVSSHGGAIRASAMTCNQPSDPDGPGQFDHPLVVRAKLEISSACHAHGKVPSHCVVTEFAEAERLRSAARLALHHFGFTRMWSIHPAQIRPILEALAPADQEIDQALEILLLALKADWAPVSHHGRLHDRASYRYFWLVLERAYRTGRKLPQEAQAFFSSLRVCRTT
jgi:citrate lyase subunit beta/citryl-CoA lyase